MEFLLSADGSLISLGVAAFLAATLLPASSEAALFAVLKLHPELFWPAIGVATLANTAGGMTTYLIGRFAAAKKPLTQLARIGHWGAPATFFAWLPLIGDGLVLAAGWLKANWVAVLLFQAAGRLARYWVVAHGATW